MASSAKSLAQPNLIAVVGKMVTPPTLCKFHLMNERLAITFPLQLYLELCRLYELIQSETSIAEVVLCRWEYYSKEYPPPWLILRAELATVLLLFISALKSGCNDFEALVECP